jgi:hypothetical protein
MAANMYFNWAYRRMVNPLPKSALTPLAKILDRLQEEIRPPSAGQSHGMPEGAPGLQVQLGRDYLGFTNRLEVHLEGVLDEGTAHMLEKRMDTLVRKAGSDVLVHFGDLTTVTPQAAQLLLEGNRKAFEQ